MNPQTAQKVEVIDIDYSADPPGQVGDRPRIIALYSKVKFNQKNPGTLTLEFIGDSPLENGAKTVGPNQEWTVVKSGNFPYKCIIVHPGGTKVEIDPRNGPGGGEIRIPPGN